MSVSKLLRLSSPLFQLEMSSEDGSGCSLSGFDDEKTEGGGGGGNAMTVDEVVWSTRCFLSGFLCSC